MRRWPEMLTEEEYNYRIIKLVHSCPLDLENPNCPLKEVRKREFAAKARWLACLSLFTKKSIYSYHLHCYFDNLDRAEREESVCAKESDSERRHCDKIDIVVSDEVKEMVPECEKGFSCLSGGADQLCEVAECIFESILYVRCLSEKSCAHKYAIGGSTFCSCPIRKEIHKKYHI